LRNECIDRGGIVHRFDSCAEGFECPAACCFPETGECSEFGETDCENFGGNFQEPGTVCEGFECPGACCIEGECTDLPVSVCQTSQTCERNSDCPGGQSGQCRNGVCRTIRCTNDADCPGRVPGSCSLGWCNLDGFFQPESCAFTECPEACCLPDGTCVDVEPTFCVEVRGGEPAGPRSTTTARAAGAIDAWRASA
jgi:hypothetical protein